MWVTSSQSRAFAIFTSAGSQAEACESPTTATRSFGSWCCPAGSWIRPPAACRSHSPGTRGCGPAGRPRRPRARARSPRQPAGSRWGVQGSGAVAGIGLLPSVAGWSFAPRRRCPPRTPRPAPASRPGRRRMALRTGFSIDPKRSGSSINSWEIQASSQGQDQDACLVVPLGFGVQHEGGDDDQRPVPQVGAVARVPDPAHRAGSRARWRGRTSAAPGRSVPAAASTAAVPSTGTSAMVPGKRVSVGISSAPASSGGEAAPTQQGSEHPADPAVHAEQGHDAAGGELPGPSRGVEVGGLRAGGGDPEPVGEGESRDGADGDQEEPAGAGAGEGVPADAAAPAQPGHQLPGHEGGTQDQQRPGEVELFLHGERPVVLHHGGHLPGGRVVGGVGDQRPVLHVEARPRQGA